MGNVTLSIDTTDAENRAIVGRDGAAAVSSTAACSYQTARMIDAWSDGTYWYVQY